MKKNLIILAAFIIVAARGYCQQPPVYNATDIYQQLQKLTTFGSVLYVAAHPDDENTRLLAYLANEKHFRTGYLSLTRGDGGQNLIGDEQGIDLGLIRTQELLSARRIDGAEQFFTRAYDFGFSKNPEETFRIWDREKVLSDVVWVIRKFRPDVIITRFPTTGEGGHGHHTASAILAGEAFDAAADPKRFPEQLKYVKIWRAKRLLWNTFNFGGTNTTREDQFQIDCGVFNPLLGKSYGEIAAESRSRHKSQGFGVPAQRGRALEYFSLIKGDKPVTGLMDGIDSAGYNLGLGKQYFLTAKNIAANFDFSAPQKSVQALDLLKRTYEATAVPGAYRTELLKKIIAQCGGLFMEATAVNQQNVAGDSMKLRLTFNNRSGITIASVNVSCFGQSYSFTSPEKNIQNENIISIKLPASEKLSQPYFLREPMNGAMYTISDQTLIGFPEINDYIAKFNVSFNGDIITYDIPVVYKFTDPVKGEVYQNIHIIPKAFVNASPSLVLLKTNDDQKNVALSYNIQVNTPIAGRIHMESIAAANQFPVADSIVGLSSNSFINFRKNVKAADIPSDSVVYARGRFTIGEDERLETAYRKITYDHIPEIFYTYPDRIKIVKTDIRIAGSRAGYIVGAGDKVPEALEEMGYTVSLLTEKDITADNLKDLDVVITGVRAYNVHSWLSAVYPALMKYVSDGGILVSQYNTNNSIGPVKAAISPYAFNISRSRVTDETAKVNFLLPEHPFLNYPNKISDKDFAGWIQERSIYDAEMIDSHYEKILSIADPGEAMQEGALIATNYGKGRFVYTGLVFFRELPAGVPGAFRLFANIIAKRVN